jgi:hypothetical protein
MNNIKMEKLKEKLKEKFYPLYKIKKNRNERGRKRLEWIRKRLTEY